MMLKLENITAGYVKDSPILKGINLTVSGHEVIGIVGQNGSGKSTLAKTIINLVPHVTGKITWNDQSITGKSTNETANTGIGYFMQGGRIFPHLTVEENLDFVCSHLSRGEAEKRKTEIKGYFELFNQSGNGRMGLQASYLSGGEQHQLALAMVLLQKPELLILDEPSAGLSPQNAEKLYESLEKIREEKNKAMMIIEQNVRYAVDFCKKIYLLSEGRIVREEKSENLKTIDTIDEFFFGKVKLEG